MGTATDVPVLLCAAAEQWEAWLGEHHTHSGGVWLQIGKKDSGLTSVSYSDALDVALCYGWIDGQKKPYNEQSWLQRFTPRRPRSMWSIVNTQRADRLIESGRMRQAGQREVDVAKQDGRWDRAYAAQSTMAVPKDFQLMLDNHQGARAFFETLDKRNRYAICFRIETAKKPETRVARIEKFITMLAHHEKPYP